MLHVDVLQIRDEVVFFQTVRAALVKSTPPVGKAKEDLDAAIRQIVSKAAASDEVVNIFSATGLKKPDISIPIHYGTFPVLRGTPQEYQTALGQTTVQVFPIPPGDKLTF